MNGPLQVGIIGASAKRGWARISHVPAIQKLQGLELGAVVSGNQASADAAARAFGASIAYGRAADLFQDPTISIISVTVKVPDHRDLVLGALAAGKHIYCEWPLGRNLEETEELAQAAKSAGVHCAIGLQTRLNPVLQQAKSLILSGTIGRVLSAQILSSTMAFGGSVETAMAFAEDSANGVTLLTVQGAHTIDFGIALLGKFEDLSALATTQFPDVHIGDAAISQKRLIPDHLFLHSRLASRGALGIEVAGGRPATSTPFRFQIVGDKGELVLNGGAPRGFQSGELQLLLNGQVQKVDMGELTAIPENAFNVAGVYAALRNDILSGSQTVSDFTHAVRLTRLVDDALASSREGTRKLFAGWPED